MFNPTNLEFREEGYKKKEKVHGAPVFHGKRNWKMFFCLFIKIQFLVSFFFHLIAFLKLETSLISGWIAKCLSGYSDVSLNMLLMMLKMKLFSCFAVLFPPAATGKTHLPNSCRSTEGSFPALGAARIKALL